KMRIALYNEAAAQVFKLPAGNAGKSVEKAARPRSGVLTDTARAHRLTDATRDPAINSAFRRVFEDGASIELRVEMADRERRSFQLNVAPLGSDLAVGVFFNITQLEKLERVRREFFANLSHELRTPLTA